MQQYCPLIARFRERWEAMNLGNRFRFKVALLDSLENEESRSEIDRAVEMNVSSKSQQYDNQVGWKMFL